MTMEDANVVTQCTKECMPNCQEVIYTYGMDTTYLKAFELCNDEANLREVFISLHLEIETTFTYITLISRWLSAYGTQLTMSKHGFTGLLCLNRILPLMVDMGFRLINDISTFLIENLT